MLLNLHKFIAFETMDPFLARQVGSPGHCDHCIAGHDTLCISVSVLPIKLYSDGTLWLKQ